MNPYLVNLVSGVVWLVRNGENNVQRAIETESDVIQGEKKLII